MVPYIDSGPCTRWTAARKTRVSVTQTLPRLTESYAASSPTPHAICDDNDVVVSALAQLIGASSLIAATLFNDS
jgi:hypothetical protein